MNFSQSYNLRKPLSLLLATALTATLLSGCSLFKKDTSGTEDTTPQAPGISLSDTSAPTETEAPTTEATEPVNENTATVTSQINIRSSPSTEATIVGTLDAGDKVEISRREEVTGISWAYIISPEAGWIVMDYVEMDIPSQMPSGGDTSTPAGGNTTTEPTSGSSDTLNLKGVITVNNLNIRSEPDGNVQGSYNKGDVVTILETKNGWGRTNKGWIKMEYVNTTGTTTGGSSGSSSANGSTGSNKFPYPVYLNIYKDTLVGSPDKRVEITKGAALDGTVTLSEVKNVVKNYYTAKDSDGISYDGLYIAEGNWVADYVDDTAKHDSIDAGTMRQTGTVYINVMIGNAKAKSSSTADASNPKTGDAIFVPMMVMGLTGTALAAAYVFGKKRIAR